MDPALGLGWDVEVSATEQETSMNIVRIGLDLAKYVFHLHGVDEHGKVVLRKTLRRPDVAPFFANLPRCVVGMEASNGAHYWAKTLSEFGHDVRLISPQFVTPYVKSNKNDRNDAEAICEAVGRPNLAYPVCCQYDELVIICRSGLPRLSNNASRFSAGFSR